MSMRNMFFLSLVLCSSASMVGMSFTKNGSRLAVRVVAQLARKNVARLKTDLVRLPITSKEVAIGERGSIIISPEDMCWKLLFVDYSHISDDMITATLYMRSKDRQYVSLARHGDVSKLLGHIQDGMEEGVALCTKNGRALEQIAAICVNRIRFNDKYVPEFDKSYEQLLRDTQTNVCAVAKKYNLSGHVIVDDYVVNHWNIDEVDGFKVFLNPQSTQSVYKHTQDRDRDYKIGIQYEPRLLCENQKIVAPYVRFSRK